MPIAQYIANAQIITNTYNIAKCRQFLMIYDYILGLCKNAFRKLLNEINYLTRCTTRRFILLKENMVYVSGQTKDIPLACSIIIISITHGTSRDILEINE